MAVRSAAVGWVDLLMTSGQYQHMPKPPYCPGLEYSGDVIWTGDDVLTGSSRYQDDLMETYTRELDTLKSWLAR